MASIDPLAKNKSLTRSTAKPVPKSKNVQHDDIEDLLMAHVVIQKKAAKPTSENASEDELVRKRPGRSKGRPRTKHLTLDSNVKVSPNKSIEIIEDSDKNTRKASPEVSEKRRGKVSEKYAAYISSKTKTPTIKKTQSNSPKARIKTHETLSSDKLKENESNVQVEKLAEVEIIDQKEVHQCQLCGTKSHDLIDLNGSDAQGLQLREKIKKHMPQQISNLDTSSHHICTMCKQTVINWAQYYEHCTRLKTVTTSETIEAKEVYEEEKEETVNETEETLKTENRIISDSEDNIEKMLREMHEMEPEYVDVNCSTSPQLLEEEMEMEFLDHEKDLVDQALLHQKISITVPPSTQSIEEILEEKHDVHRKIIRMDRKLSEDELRSLLERTGFKSLTTVFLMKFNNKRKFQFGDLEKFYKDTKDKCDRVKNLYKNKENLSNDHYENLAKSYAHLTLDNVQTEKEMFFRCPECRVYLASKQFTKHYKLDHNKLVALCDFCRLLLPYETQEQKKLVMEHINLHESKQKHKSPEIITNINKLIESQKLTEEASDISKHRSSETNPSYLNYSCNRCDAQYTKESEIAEHVKLHKRERVVCDVCAKTFESRFELIQHDDEHKDCDSKLICETCGESYSNLETYEIHLQSHANENQLDYTCPHCRRKYVKRNEFLIHLKTHGEKTHICKICSCAFSQRDHLLDHKKTVHGMNLLHCPHCNFFSPFSSRLKLHLKAQHGNSSFNCDECQDSFVSMKKLREHMIQNHARNLESFDCPLCDWKFVQETNLQKHFDVHVEKGHTKCKVCNALFFIKGLKLEISDVEEHKAEHTNEENAIFKRPYSPSVIRMTSWRDNKALRMYCRDCNESFATPLELRKHQRCHKPFYCNICQSVSNNEQTFTHHMLQHEDRKFECTECKKRFVSNNALSLHVRNHSDTFDFQCSVCERRFKRPFDWKRHEMTCLEMRGLPTNTTIKSRRNQRKQNKDETLSIYVKQEDENQAVELVDSSQKDDEYVLVNNPESDEVYIPKEEIVELILEDENSVSDEMIEIDESELAAFREWQKVAMQNTQSMKRNMTFDTISGKRIRLVPQSDDDGLNNSEQMFYSIEQVDDKSQKSEFIDSSSFILHENINEQMQSDNNETNNEEKFVINNENYIIDNGEISEESAVYVNAEDESHVVHVLDGSSNIVYNMDMDGTINDLNMQTIADENILFQQTEPSTNDTNHEIEMVDSHFENISYVFDNAINSSELGKVATIYLQKDANTDQVVMNDINQSIAIVDKSQIKVVKVNNQ